MIRIKNKSSRYKPYRGKPKTIKFHDWIINDLLHLIFLFLIPSDITMTCKFKLSDRRFLDFQKYKFIDKRFRSYYDYYFNLYGTKYKLISRYNQHYYPP